MNMEQLIHEFFGELDLEKVLEDELLNELIVFWDEGAVSHPGMSRCCN